MNKFFKKLFAPIAIFAMALGVTISVNTQNGVVGANAASSVFATADFTTMANASTSYNSKWTYATDWNIYGGANNNAGWAYVKFGGKSTTLATANPTYVNNIVAMGSAISKINVSYVVGTLTVGSVNTWGVRVYSDSTMTTLVDESFLTGLTKPTVSVSYDFFPSSTYQVANSTAEWATGLFYKVFFDLSNTTTTNGIVWVDKVTFYKEASLISVSNVSIVEPLSTIVAVGTPLDLQESVLPVDATDKSVTWSSSDSSIAEVNQVGLVTGIKAGEVTITATSNSDGSKLDTIVLTITSNVNVYDKTITAADLGMLTTYVDGNYVDEDVVYYAYQVMKNSSSQALQFRGTPSGYLFNKTAYASDINTISIKHSATNTETSYALYVGNASNPNSSITITGSPDVSDPSIIVFDVSSVGNYKYFTFTRTSTTGTVYLDGIIVELASLVVDSAREYANTFLTTLDSECATLNVSNSSWTTLAASYSSLSNEAKIAFANELSTLRVTDIQRTLSRYTYVVLKYGYSDFMGLSVSPSSPHTLGQNTGSNNVYLIMAIGLVSITSIFGYYYLTKKKKVA